MFTSLLEHNMTVKRLTTSTGGRRTYTEIGPYPCNLQPLDAAQVALYGMAMGRGLKLYTDIEADILPSDSVTVNGLTYKVNGIKRYDFGHFQHLELIVELEDA